MNLNQVIYIWCTAVICMQLIPWSISGIEGIFQKIPDDDSESTKNIIINSKFISELFQNQIVIFFVVPIGIILLDQVEIYGLVPSLPIYYYLLSPVLGSLLIYFGIKISKLVASIMQKYFINQLEHDCKQYAYNMKNVFQKKTWQKIALGLFNGFSEELLLRVFLMGFMINYLKINPIYALLTSLFLNGLHHTKQGRILGTSSIVFIQLFYGVAYLIYNDFLLIGLMHMGTDITGLLLPTFLNRKKKNDDIDES
jgi:membrane protease YdiL (CAAX protease family)